MKVEISTRAQREAKRLDSWWREHRDAQELFALEFQEAVEILGTVRIPGAPWPTSRRPRLRRLLLKKTNRHVYFEIFERKQVVRIVTVWGAPRKPPPKL